MLAALGYHVGHAEGRPQTERREILKHVLFGELPMVYSASYTDEWGEPGSYKRYGKLIRSLQTYIDDNQSRPGKKLAVQQWREDLEWVEQLWHSSDQS
jgi:hypothetical protein